MKFNDIKQDQWTELKPYLDTCLLPLTGLTGMEQPWEVTQSLEKLRDTMERIEIPFAGRIVTYPAIQYIYGSPEFTSIINEVCENLKRGGFTYVILVTADSRIAELEFSASDLLVSSSNGADTAFISDQIKKIWNNKLDHLE